MSKRLFLATLSLVVAAFAGGYAVGRHDAPVLMPPAIDGFLWPASPRLQAFSLRDEMGRDFTEASLAHHWTLLFFGYTYCPDVCPGTLAVLKQVASALQDTPALASQLQVVFVSVDAARDTPEVLRAYVRHFNPAFRAATAPLEQLHLLTRQLDADVARIADGGSDDYWFDHSTSIYLIAPDLRITGAFESPHEASDLAARLRGIYAFLTAAG